MSDPFIKEDGLRVDDVVIPAASNVTPAIHIKTRTLAGFYFPVAMTSASVAIEVSPDGSQWFQTPTSLGTYAVASDTYQAVDPAYFVGVAYVRLVSGTNEAANRTLKVVSILL